MLRKPPKDREPERGRKPSGAGSGVGSGQEVGDDSSLRAPRGGPGVMVVRKAPRFSGAGGTQSG